MPIVFRSLVQVAAIAVAMLAAAPSRADVVYSVDDGTAEFGVFNPVADIAWLNAFTAVSGGERITEISVLFGSPNGSGLAGGETVTIALWDDPNNDGDPNDAVLLTFQTHSIVNFDSASTFDVIALLTPTDVSGGFFVGVYANLPDIAVAGQDGDAPVGTASWLAISNAGGSIDLTDLGTSDFLLSPADLDTFGIPGNWMIRATGTAIPAPEVTVAEPTGLALFALGLAGLGVARRKRAV